ncbi:MAG: HAMP domain-containing protein [Alphaproteobacteria bacterium]|nr:HAMP domain-containing protein [Alphaproteobacteria bacterium]
MIRKKKRKWMKSLMPQTLFGRSLLILITPVLLIQVFLTLMFFDRHWSKMTTRLAYAAAGEIAIISEDADQAKTPQEIQQIADRAEERLSLLIYFEPGAQIDQDQQKHHWMGWEFMVGQTLVEELNKQLVQPFAVNVDFKEKWVEVRVQLQRGVLNISMPQRRLFASSSYIFLLWVFSASFILLTIAVLFMRNQVRPIRRLAIAAERFGKGRDVQDFKLEGAREVRQAGQAFLDMRTRIQRQISQRTAMLAGVSHDLRTPLTRLRLQLAMLENCPDVEAMKSDIRDMEKMIEGYLDFVRGEGEENPVTTEMQEILQQVTSAAKRQGCQITLEDNAGEALIIPLRPLAFRRCMDNIIGNASKYAAHIWITMHRTVDNRIEISIEDDGPGIPQDQYEEVFRPFYRVDHSRNLETGGIGLGLPIAMDIVHAHGGKIWLEKSPHGGLSVKIRLPI